MRNLKIAIVTFVSLAALSTETGCGGSSRPNPNGKEPESSSTALSPFAAGWKIEFAGQCPAASRDICKGANGFAVNDAGGFRVGPGPQGGTFDGHLTAEEFHSLQDAMTEVQADTSLAASPALCLTEDEGGETFAAVRLGPQVALSTGTALACDTLPRAGHGHALKQVLQALADKYYPIPFPTTCLAAADTLSTFYGGFQKCREDRDCTYVNPSFVPAASAAENLVTDDCSFIRPMLVANEFELITNQLNILTATEAARTACSASPTKPGCVHPVSFSVPLPPPACRGGTCVSNF